MGPYMGAWLNPERPKGNTANDYKQKLAMADFEWEMGHIELHAEGAHNFWETPTVGTVSVTGGYVEAKFTTSMGGLRRGSLRPTRVQRDLQFDRRAAAVG